MIGYGSLMNEKSKQRTSEQIGKNIPVIISGM
jgi:hypothetical protein